MPSGKHGKGLPKSGLEEDAALMEAARKSVGGNARLAKLFEVDESATSRWGQERRIPHHARKQIRELVAAPPPEPMASTGGQDITHMHAAVTRLDRLEGDLAPAILDHLVRQIELLTTMAEKIEALSKRIEGSTPPSAKKAAGKRDHT